MEFLGGRIRIDDAHQAVAAAPLVAGFVGHCPGRLIVEQLSGNKTLLSELERAGFAELANRLSRGEALRPEELYFFPIPVTSGKELDRIFPDARASLPTLAALAGEARQADGAAAELFPQGLKPDAAGRAAAEAAGRDRAWLPGAADDFFAEGGDTLWVVRIPEPSVEPLRDGTALRLQESLGLLPDIPYGGGGTLQRILPPELILQRLGLAALFRIPQIGVVALPDLERLHIPADAEPEPPPPIRTAPVFAPCDSGASNGEAGQGIAQDEEPEPPAEAGFRAVIRMLGNALEVLRPDVQCLLTLPMEGTSRRREIGLAPSPAIDPVAIAAIGEAIGDGRPGELRRLQFLWPYLRTEARGIHSPTGAIAGRQVVRARTSGSWRSIAGMPLRTKAASYPRVSLGHLLALRESPGIGILTERSGKLTLDDERLAVPALHPGDYDVEHMSLWNGYRSGEVRRFIGYLMRELATLGDSLVFNVDATDPRPRLVLEEFFTRLHRRGALRGRQARDAFAIRVPQQREGVIAYDIEIAPAVPIDKLVLSFTNRAGEWRAGVSDA